MMLDQPLIDKIIAQVLARLAGEQVSMNSRNVVVLFCGARAGSKAGLEAIRRLSNSSHKFSVMRTDAARSITPEAVLREAGATDILLSDPRLDVASLVKRTDILLIPTLTTRMAGILSLGLMESPAATFILRMLLAGKPVVAIKDAADPSGRVAQEVYGGKSGAAPALRAQIEGHLRALSSYGVELVSEGDFLLSMERLLLNQKGTFGSTNTESLLRQEVRTQDFISHSKIMLNGIVTERDLAGFEQGASVTCQSGTKFTAQAQDTAQRLQLKLNYI